MAVEVGENIDQCSAKQGYGMNSRLDLTDKAEIVRLKKVIADFKQYDKRRSEQFRKLQQDYKLLEEAFNDIKERVDDTEYDEDISDSDDVKPEEAESQVPVSFVKSKLAISHQVVKAIYDKIEGIKPFSYFIPMGDHRNEYDKQLRKMQKCCKKMVKLFYKYGQQMAGGITQNNASSNLSNSSSTDSCKTLA